MAKINIYQRSPLNQKFSIENIFDPLYEEMKRISPLDINMIYLPYSNQGYWNKIRNVIFSWRQQADIHHIAGDIHYIAPFLPWRKVMITVHDLYFPPKISKLKKIIWTWFWMKLPFWWSAKLVCISNFTKDEVKKHYAWTTKKCTVVSNFVSNEFKTLHHKMIDYVAREEKTILHIGTKPNKNLIRLIEAVKDLDVKLLIIGNIPIEELDLLKKYQILFENLENTDYEEIVRSYIRSSMLFFASLQEGFGLPILEGQVAGIPVISSNRRPMSDIAGEGAILVDPLNVGEIRATILELLSHPKKVADLVNEGYQNAVQYSIEKSAESYLAVYNQLLV